ncbi:hypothetical protein I0C86_03070 [Plantactinospora sp. S1510]|uniref:ATP-grasp domain-containing protein n=1 Tax=Plantactinospora alkalitolerans TaxID=2789879 RepID=A0ABS0GP68_9ACTN|nr:hypothetical protein [Plantactinospora alkalitolerans]MBF9127983.1 hypothetical protein [Plantactinospora alkalitolerans]
MADLVRPDRLVVIDASSLQPGVVAVAPDQTVFETADGTRVNVSDRSMRGWLRRLAPANWSHGTMLGSHEAAVMASRVALLAAIIRDPKIEWITSLDSLYAAENKVVQYRAAEAAGIRVPKTLISADPDHLAAELGEPFILKPLGPGNFEADGSQHVVYVTEQRVNDIRDADLFAAPFLAQSLVHAHTHLRVVTVREEAWVAELDGRGLPVDWRSHIPAHSSFRAARWPTVAAEAGALAASLRLGMTCQDWMIDDDGPVFTDINPGGQWLFLPDEVAEPATRALAGWLTDR